MNFALDFCGTQLRQRREKAAGADYVAFYFHEVLCWGVFLVFFFFLKAPM